MRRGYRGTDVGGTSRYADPPPKLTTIKKIRKAKKVREELNGEAKKREISKVTLPKFSWDK
jgi:hypothetical protein